MRHQGLKAVFVTGTRDTKNPMDFCAQKTGVFLGLDARNSFRISAQRFYKQISCAQDTNLGFKAKVLFDVS